MKTVPQPAPLPPRAPDWLAGLWRRDAIVLPDGTEDRTTQVFWGQTHSLYVDLRIPTDRPQARGRRSFMEFDLDELRGLADQKGFAGHIVMDGEVCSWVRYIDYRPNTGRPDSGRLRLEGEILYEEGDPTSVLASAYREIYSRECRATRRSVALRRLSAAGDAGHGDAVLVLIEDRFLFARDRAIALPAAETLRDLVVAAGEDRAKIYAYLDCEISLGGTEGGDAWRVEASTLPFREGSPLLPRSAVEATGDGAMLVMTGGDGVEHWQIVESAIAPGELARLLSRGAGSAR